MVEALTLAAIEAAGKKIAGKVALTPLHNWRGQIGRAHV